MKIQNKQEQKIKQKQKSKVTKDMQIGEIVGRYPESSEVIQKYGLHCVGCHVSAFESLEEGCLGHGMDEQEIDNLVKDINSVIDSQSKENKNTSKSSSKQNKEQAKTGQAKEGSIEITSSAVEKVKELMKKENKSNHSLRVAVVPGGCSGFSYELSFVEKGEENDLEMEKDKLKIYVDRDSLEYLNGAKIDFVDTLQESGFKIDNPNVKSSCGCGNSFN